MALAAGPTSADEAGKVQALIRDLKSPEFEKAYPAVEELGKYPQYKDQVAPALIEALKSHDWDRCAGDMRDMIARRLGELKAREAVVVLLDVVRRGTPIEQECVEGCSFLAVTPGDLLTDRAYEPFCGNGVLATIDALADVSHSKAMADLVAEGKWKGELLLTIGRVAPPRYAHFIARHKDDPDVYFRQAVAAALGLIDNDATSVPVLVQLLHRGDRERDFFVKWEASSSLIKIARRGRPDAVRSRVMMLLPDADNVTAVLAARVLAALGDARGLARLRELANDGDPQIRTEAVLALGEVADAGSKELLTQRLKDESLTMRACAIYALGRIGGSSVIPVLRRAVEESTRYEKDPERRRRGAESDQLLEKYGFAGFDLRETLQEAVETAQRSGGR